MGFRGVKFPKNVSSDFCVRELVLGDSLLLSRSSPGGSEVKASASNAGDPGLIPGSGRSPGERKDYPLQYSCLENSMGRSWQVTVHGVAKSWT